MNSLTPHHIFIILIYLKCYDTINPTPDSTFQSTYFLKNTPWQHHYFSQSHDLRNAAFDSGFIYKYTPENLNKPKSLPVPSFPKTHDDPPLKIVLKDSAKAFNTSAVPKYEYRPKEVAWRNGNEIFASKTLDQDKKWWSEYFYTLDNNNQPRIKAINSSPIYAKDNLNFNQREPTRTPYTLYPKRQELISTRTSSRAQDLVQYQKKQVKTGNGGFERKTNMIHIVVYKSFNYALQTISLLQSTAGYRPLPMCTIAPDPSLSASSLQHSRLNKHQKGVCNMWHLIIYSVMIHQYYVDGRKYEHFLEPLDSEDKILIKVTECITVISDLELKFRPTVVIDTQNIKNETKGNMFAEKVANKLMTNNIPTLIVDNGMDTNLQISGLVVTYFDICDDITIFNFSGIDTGMKHLIVISDPPDSNCINKLQEIRNSVDKYDITFKLLDITEERNNLITFIPKLDENTCKQIVENYYHINTCVNGTLRKTENAPINLNNCPLKVGMTALHPFSQITTNEVLKTYDQINVTDGSDVEILKVIAEHFNATLDLYYIYRKEENPNVNIDFLKFVINGSLDVCAGGLYRMYGDVVEYSGLYGRQAALWIYAVEREERSWENLLENMRDLYMFLIFYMSYSISWYLICIFDGDSVSFKDTLTYGWGALVGGTTLKEARSIKQKILNMGLFLLRIYLFAYISIHLYSFLTIKKPPEMVTTDDDLMSSGRVAFLESSTKYFVEDEIFLDFANTSSECVSFKDCMDKTLLENGMTIALQGNFYQFQADTAINGEARMVRLPEHILTVYNEMVVRKDSPLVDDIQEVIQNLFEAGITDALYARAIGLLVIGKADRVNSNMLMHSYSCQSGCTITLKQFAVIFYAWIFGCVLAFVVFILELFGKRI